MALIRWCMILLVLLTACENALQAVPIGERQAQTITEPAVSDPCSQVSCTGGKTCEAGACVCPEKTCGDNCVSESACCSDDDCAQGSCVNHACTKLSCKYNEEAVDGACECAQGYKFCDDQNKCIKERDCCRHTDCPKGDRCVPTNLRASVCLDLGEKKLCRQIADNGRAEMFNVGSEDFRIETDTWFANQSIALRLNDESITLGVNSSANYSAYTLYQEGVEELGGFCKEDNDE